MKTELWCIGKSKFSFIEEGVDILYKRISRYAQLQIVEIPKAKISKNASPQQVKLAEASALLKKIRPSDFLILLDEAGKTMSSKGFAQFIEAMQLKSTPRLIFLIGGAYGFDLNVYQRSNFKLSLSSMTFSHQLIKLIFLEQFYRAMTILHNHPYHND